MNPRVSWDDLPASVRCRIEADAGTFEREEQVAAARGLWHDISSADSQLWKRETADAARRWAIYRGLWSFTTAVRTP